MIIVLMGVSGSGKTSVGKKLAGRLSCQFVDADDFHSAANKAKMHSGIPLTDEDRRPWLQSLANLISEHRANGASLVLACSALKEAYRTTIKGKPDCSETVFVYLKVSPPILEKRLRRRRHEFMNPALLKSQLETLEEPDNAIVVDAGQKLEATVDDIVEALT